MPRRRGRRRRPPDRAHLLEVLERVLDRGIVIDGWGEISLGGIPLLAVDMHIVVASLDTYVSYAGAVAPSSPGPDLAAGPQESPSVETALPAPEAVIRAAEEYLRRLGRGEPPEH